MPRYDLTDKQMEWVGTSDDPLAANIRTLVGMYKSGPDQACLGLLDGAVEELLARWPEIVKVEGMRTKSLHQRRVEDLMRQANQDLPDRPTLPDEKTRLLRAKLILEEAMETVEALGVSVGLVGVTYGDPMGQPSTTMLSVDRSALRLEANREPDLEGIADGCADIIVVTTGTLSACGIADESVQAEVDLNNLRKFEHHCPKCEGPGVAIEGVAPGQRSCLDCGEIWVSGHSREDGKWVKPWTHKPPDIAGVLAKQTEAVEGA